ncbi:DUF1014-domain-containing protein [Patellaria atrata CBS 101060]|uniref:DUF1014-domain-containing protein n=1 Tax=Patellaria atrata CBS 101060 TaxID=1346257 RepID=A0A9P4SCP9_9PEZI|nr:DUF1014-domain-containing protein [Patellaria atrata CBS 101060]
MAKKNAGENSKKVAGNARKAEAAAAKQAVEQQKISALENDKWSKGSKSTAKADAAAEKAAEAARKKAEKAALLREEEASQPSKPKGAGTKTAQKKNVKPASSSLDAALSSFDGASPLNASGIDNALDALSLTSNANEKVEKHPERRFKAAYTQFEERRLDEMKDDKGLRRNQKVELIRKEFEKHPDNPFNQVSARYNSTRDEISELRAQEKAKTEARLAGPS